MTAPFLIAEEQRSTTHMLIIDHLGEIGSALATAVVSSFPVVLVSGKEASRTTGITSIAYTKKIPQIPDATYSHIFVVFNGEQEMIHFLPELTRKAHSSGSTVFFISSMYSLSKPLYEKLHLQYPSIQFVLYGDLATQEIRSRISYLVEEAILYGSLKLPETGLALLYPTTLSFLVQEIIKLASGTLHPAHPPFVLFSPTPVTEITFSRLLKNRYPLLRVDFISGKRHTPPFFVPQDAIYAKPSKEILLSWIKSLSLVPVKEQKNSKPLKQPKNTRPYQIFPIVLVILFFLFLPVGMLFATAGSGTYFLYQAEKNVEKGNIEQAAEQAKKATGLFTFAKGLNNLFSVVGGSVGLAVPLSQLNDTIGSGEQLADAGSDLLYAVIPLKNTLGKGGDISENEFLASMNQLKRSLVTLQEARVQGDIPPFILKKLYYYDPSIKLFSGIVDALPSFLGLYQQKKYLVLLQNNTELRPGGGFIGSYGLLTLKGGKIQEFTLHDVYDADGQLTGHIDPPFYLSRYMGAAHWYLRDSNMDISFPKNATQAAFFLQKETGETVDGVIAVDTTFLKNLLLEVGPVAVPEYKQTITSENVVLLTQDHAEKDFFPGSTQKKDFLKAFYAALTHTLSTKQSVYPRLLTRLSQSAYQKHMLFYFNSDSLQKIFSLNGLTGELPEYEENDAVISDIFGVNEANIGQNKVNQYVERRMDQQIQLNEKGELTESATLTYINTSTKTSPYGGDYKQYLRFILPTNAILSSVQIDGQDQVTTPAITDSRTYGLKSFVPPKELEVETVRIAQEQTIGMLITVPQGVTKKVTITYTLASGLKNDSDFTYKRLLVKQPGTVDDAYSFSFRFPSLYTVKQSATSNLQQAGDSMIGRGFLTEDTALTVHLIKK